MPLTTQLPWLMTAIAASIAGMLSGVMSNVPALSWAAAGLYAAALIAVAVDINRPWWEQAGSSLDHDAAVAAVIRNTRLLILGYIWGSLALLFVYRLSGLRWQHGLQYGAAMAVMAWLMLAYVHFLAKPGSVLRSPRALAFVTRLSLAHAAAALSGITFMIVSGKLRSIKGDWAANQVFLAGGVAVIGLSLISSYTQFRLGTLRRRADEPNVGAPSN